MGELIALKPLIYQTRQLRAGDRFTVASFNDAAVLKTVGLAKEITDVPIDYAKTDELATLRQDYMTKFGKAPDMRWGARRLRQEMDGGE